MADPKNAERLALLERIALEEIRRRARRGPTREPIRDRAPDAVLDHVSRFDALDALEDEVEPSLDTWLVRVFEELDDSLAQGAAADSDRLDALISSHGALVSEVAKERPRDAFTERDCKV